MDGLKGQVQKSINELTPAQWDSMRAKYAKKYAKPAEEEAKKSDEVNNPFHYNQGGIECIEAIQASMTSEAFQGYLKGNCLKYLWRLSYKGKAKQDAEKAQWYLNKLAEELK